MLLLELCLLKLEWDDELPKGKREVWDEMVSDLSEIGTISIPTIFDKICWNSLNSSAIIYEFPFPPSYNIVSNKSCLCMLSTLTFGCKGEE